MIGSVFSPGQRGPALAGGLIALFLILFLVVPMVQVVVVAFQHPNTGAPTLINFVDFFRTSLFQESFINSFYVAAMSVVLSSLFALPLAYFTTRFNFGGALLIQTLGVIPLIMPPFVGAVAMAWFLVMQHLMSRRMREIESREAAEAASGSVIEGN